MAHPGSPQLRVLHVIDHLGHGGAQVLLANICTGGERDAVAHEVLSLHGQGLYADRLQDAHVPVRSLAAARLNLPAILARLAARVRRRDYDLLHLHLNASSALGAVVGRALGRAPILMTIYNLREQHPHGGYNAFTLVHPLVDHYVTLWDNNDLPDSGVPRAKISVIPIGIDVRGANPSRHEEVRRALGRQYNIAWERPLLLSVARLHPNRKIHLLVEALPQLVAEHPDVALLMVGEGEERGRLEAFVAQHGLERNVVFAGARTDLWDLLPGCDLYLSASGKCDLGVAAMQAMACERPVVTYTLAPESMQSAEQECTCQGVFLQTRDAQALARTSARLLADPGPAADLGRRGRAAILRDFSLERMVRRYEELYRKLVADRRRGAANDAPQRREAR